MTGPRDKQRFRRIYPFYKRRPVLEFDEDIIVEASGSGTVIRDMNIQSFNMFLGSRESIATSGTKDSIGMTYYDPTKFNIDPSTLTYKFRCIFATNQTNIIAYADMYDYNGLVSGTPQPFSGTVLTGSILALSQFEADVTSLFVVISSPGIIEARVWLGSNQVSGTLVVKNARLDAIWP
jgi:hypothetical protein